MHACKHEIVGRCELAKKEMFFFLLLSLVTSTPWLGASALPPMRDAREPGKRGSG
jgi:hypothetical protein